MATISPPASTFRIAGTVKLCGVMSAKPCQCSNGDLYRADSPEMKPVLARSMIALGTTLTLGGGRSVCALSQRSGVDLLGNDEGVIEFDI